MTEPCDLSVLDASGLIASRRLSPVELFASVMRRLEQTEPVLHAYVMVDAEGAACHARAAEREIVGGEYRSPFHGIPVAVKDIFDLEGLPTRCGSRARENAEPALTDAEPVAMMRRSGAIFVGKTVTQEFAAGVVSAPARNPWNPDRIPGGSSGGSGAAVAAGSALAAFGSDTGGSIRNPAAINGIAGLKPTFGSVSTAGVFPLAWSLDTVGPLTKSVADAAAFFEVIRGPAARGVPASAEIGQSLRGVRIGALRSYFLDRVQTDVGRALDEAYRCLAELGAEVLYVEWPEAAAARAASFVINRVETAAVHRETIREAPHLLAEELRLRIESNALFPAAGYLRALRARTLVKHAIARLFAEHRLDAAVVPTAAGTAARADDLTVAYADESTETVHLAYTRLTMPFNATGQPVLAVPCGFDRNGLPIGMQIAGRPYGEARICRIGHAYEQAAGWVRRRPPLIEQKMA